MPSIDFNSKGSSISIFSDEVEIACEKCQRSFFILGGHLKYDTLGPNKYAGNLDFECPNCNNPIEIWLRYSYEHERIPKYSDVGISGGSIIKGFGNVELSLGDKLYTLEEPKLYLPEQKKIASSLIDGVADLIDRILIDSSILYKIPSRIFEELIATVFSKHGFQVELTKKTRDGGRDIIAIRSDLGIKSKYIIECKRYASHHPVRVDLVRGLYGVQVQEGANKSVLATTSYFTPDAKEFASKIGTTEWAMDLKDYQDIVLWISKTKKI